jgi:hypothetical protein
MADLAAEKTYLRTRSTQIPNRIENPCHLLPAFDEYSVAYKNREGGLGPTIIINGRVVGTWKRDSATITLNVSRKLNKSKQRAIAKATERYLEFIKQ